MSNDKTPRRSGRSELVGMIALALAFAGLAGHQIWLNTPSGNTRVSPDFDLAALRALQPGETASEVEAKLGRPFDRYQSGGEQTWSYSRSKDHRGRHILHYDATFDIATRRLLRVEEQEIWDSLD